MSLKSDLTLYSLSLPALILALNHGFVFHRSRVISHGPKVFPVRGKKTWLPGRWCPMAFPSSSSSQSMILILDLPSRSLEKKNIYIYILYAKSALLVRPKISPKQNQVMGCLAFFLQLQSLSCSAVFWRNLSKHSTLSTEQMQDLLQKSSPHPKQPLPECTPQKKERQHQEFLLSVNELRSTNAPAT